MEDSLPREPVPQKDSCSCVVQTANATFCSSRHSSLKTSFTFDAVQRLRMTVGIQREVHCLEVNNKRQTDLTFEINESTAGKILGIKSSGFQSNSCNALLAAT